MATLADAPGECCSTKTIEHTGNAQGSVEKIAGIDTYISRPATLGECRNIILFFADVFGPFFLNSQLIMDYWASHGYLVLAIDYFEGDPIQSHLNEPNFSIVGWAASKLDRGLELVDPWLNAVRNQFGTSDTKWATVGYCFGAPSVMNCLATDWIAAGAFAHPAFLNEDHFRNVKKPLLLSCAEVDHTFPLESRRRAEDILIENKSTYHMQVFSSVSHGFAVRGNMNDSVAKWAKEQSAQTILSWFNMFCSRENQ
ncbi:hypothetical protein AcW1_001467 [Taiwanofungus camphoratus]|nr:hypothetical protein AcW2_000001 [Antrodia cinnamomea]KAI0937492.1 hypothetical protein AcV5_005393 [Antrodia cinnamomea]KAI0962702.1 hypothetical protein AcV7_001490 [Antrodia cinnamomea]KAI0964703.1 hypothetical protein AcW1_001467 [Antrodia cinnamomea]